MKDEENDNFRSVSEKQIIEYIKENLKSLEHRPYDQYSNDVANLMKNYLKDIFKYPSLFTAGQLREYGVYIPEYTHDDTTMYPLETDVSFEKYDSSKLSLDMHFTFDEEVYNIENAITEVLSEMDIPETVDEKFKRNVMMRVMNKFKGSVNPSKVADSINKRFEKET